MTENNSSAPKPTGRGRRASSAQDRAEVRSIDELDRAIIRILQKNGRTNNTDIAKELDVTETTIRKRIAQLLEDDMINVVAVPTPKAVGSSTSAIIGISVALQSIHRVSDQLRKCPEVRYVGMSAGRYDIMIEVFASDQEHLLEFVTDCLGSMDGITDVETSVILKVAKFSYEWEII
ncbi:Lrp/AsnC family transcriptional regulator [Pseudonocardia acidicola]|uniref:Lrp/AsnC family transcriptional regulator n=1 Tax=Pseudonocardia acidicola TaxID=2724939 RepID=A0ABX1SJV8_9PSEU|nr:Lrp/AsnC family transcriptional regulator [Pseudonocardia acidicola]NMI01859.1 Lrp/AsnC family transcriptional regulator [Pseudonocardia acidicola]